MDNEFQTTDIVLAATLKFLGYDLKNIERNGNKGTFVFQDIPKELVADYDLGKLLVEPIAFNNAIKSLTTAARR